jgi:hypothetical protein
MTPSVIDSNAHYRVSCPVLQNWGPVRAADTFGLGCDFETSAKVGIGDRLSPPDRVRVVWPGWVRQVLHGWNLPLPRPDPPSPGLPLQGWTGAGCPASWLLGMCLLLSLLFGAEFPEKGLLSTFALQPKHGLVFSRPGLQFHILPSAPPRVKLGMQDSYFYLLRILLHP